MRDHASRQQLWDDACHLLEERLRTLLASNEVASQDAFDAWHRALAHDLRHLYHAGGFDRFSIGQAQKWINMSFKYAVTFGEDRIPGASRVFPWLHVPIDNVILDQLVGAPEVTRPWSRINRYDEEYLRLQHWIRDSFRNEAPLAVEFRLWEEGMWKRAAPSEAD